MGDRRVKGTVGGLLALALLLSMSTSLGVGVLAASDGPAVFINEIHYDNAGTDTGEAIEVAGPAGTDLTGWSLVLYNGNGGAAYGTTDLSGTIPDQQNGYGTVAVSYPSNGIQNGSPDGVALVDSGGTVVQFLSYEGDFAATGGPANGMTSTDIGVTEGSSTPVGDSLQLAGTGTTYTDFSWAAPLPNTFGAVNTGQSFGGPANAPVVVNCGGTLYVDQTFEASREVSASDADGVVDSALEMIVTPTSDEITLQNAQAVGDGASATVAVGADVEAGAYSIEIVATNQDDPPQSGSCTFTVVVNPFLTIGEVQGTVSDDDDGTSHASPYEGEMVVIQGVIYEKILSRTSSGGSSHAFFVQNTAATSDGDPTSSDGIYVYIGYYSTLRVSGGGYYTPKVGDEVILRGPISEYYNLTEMGNPYLLEIVRSDVDLDLDDELPADVVNPPSDLAAASRYWERLEGMRAQVPAGSAVLNGRDVFAITMDGEVWVATPDSAIAGRTDAYARRAFRDPHPLDDIPDQLFDNGNGYRVLMGSLGIKAAADDNTAIIAPARTFDTLTDAPIGGVYYSYGKYSVQVEQQIAFTDGPDPALNAPAEPFDRLREYSIVTFNMENLYDYRDDPNDGCDFPGNSGCEGVDPPFDYVPASQGAYEGRLQEIAGQIVDDLFSPDVIMVQEAEDQDICTVSGEAMACGTSDNADGKPDTLQELATFIAGLGGPAYDAAFDRDGADDRGIVSGFLFRTDRAELLPASADDPVLGSDPQVIYRSEPLPYNADVQNPKALNAVLPGDVDTSTGTDGSNVFTRPPQVGLFRLWRSGLEGSVFVDVYLVDNHFSSGPDGRVGQRTEQANYDAAIVAALQAADPGAYVTVGGDLNVYPRPDDPFVPGDPLYPSDQLAGLYDQGMTNLWDILVGDVPDSAYSYVYQGQAQTLDQMFVTPAWLSELVQVRASHINSDWPKDEPGDGARGTSDHDPQVARYTLLPTLSRLEALVRHLADSGDITGKKTAEILLDRLARARQFLENGQQDAYEDQLRAFIDQLQDKTPQFVTQGAADALSQEVALLLELP